MRLQSKAQLNVLTFLCFVLLSALSLSAYSFTPPEIASGTFSCVSKWDEKCEDSQTLSAPQGYKICKHDVKVIESKGDNSHEVVSVDEQNLTIAFSAKGNLDRIRQKDSSIKISVSLLGVRVNEECNPKPKPAEEDLGPPKIHACACAPLIKEEYVEKCLATGKAKYGEACDLDGVQLQCFASKNECREHNRKNCDAVVGLDKSKSKKRLFIPNSPLCAE